MSRLGIIASGASGAVIVGAFNPADKNAGITLSNANNSANGPAASSWISARSTISKAAGLHYFEVTPEIAVSTLIIGLANGAASLGNFFGSSTDSIGYRLAATPGWFGTTGAALATPTLGDIFGFAVDMNNRKIWSRLNGGLWNASGSANPAGNVGGVSFAAGMASGPIFFGVSVTSPAPVVKVNNGSAAFAFTPPSGFTAWA